MADVVTIFENPNFSGRSKTLSEGEYRFFTPADFNDVISSIRVPEGLVAMVFEHADEGGGFGIWVDLLEDWPTLSQFNLDKKISYISVFPATRGTWVWARNSIQNGQFVPGHWEHQMVHLPPPNHVPVVAPPAPPHDQTTGSTTIQVNGGQFIITALGPHTLHAPFWDHATTDQMGVIGNDFRGVEELGSAAFERESNHDLIPGSLNFWYPQTLPRDPHDHRAAHFKATLAGTVEDVHIAHIDGIYEDHDVNISIRPSEKYQHLLTNAHPREYTDIMSAQWNLSFHQSGQPDCDDSASVEEFNFIEAEIQVSGDVHSGTAQELNDIILARGRQEICVYGPWIYDRGHCCHAEIHPAEQIWWRTDIRPNLKRYSLNVFCDASQRFWWRDQMDDGTKLKPWGAPPIRGLFAIAFEAELGVVVGKPPIRFEVESEDDRFNVAPMGQGIQAYNLIYRGHTLVSFIPTNNLFKVSYEGVGLSDGNKVRGFLVLETSVGKLTQKVVDSEFPLGTDVNKIDQSVERRVFEKAEGHYMFSVLQTNLQEVLNF
jgi:hypothetical protein